MENFAGDEASRGVSRRAALGAIGAAATTALAGPAVGAAPADPLPKDALIVNSLSPIDDFYGDGTPPREGRNVVSEAGIVAALRSGLTATNYTMKSTKFQEAVAHIGQFDAQIRSDTRLRKIWTAKDIREAKRANQVGIIYGWQNTLALDDDASRVDVFADLGLRIMQLTYNSLNRSGGGSMDKTGTGLTAFGHEVVERLNACRLVVDLSHSGRPLLMDAVKASKQPICITHTGCAAVAPSPRNKTDEELRAVAERSGYVGIYFIMYLKPYSIYDSSAVVAHIEHALKVCGEDNVGIGSDYGVLGPNADRTKRDKFWAALVERRIKDGSAAEGDDPRYQPWPTDMESVDQFRVLAAALRKRGLSTRLIEKIFGLNFLRYLGDTWGG